MTQYGYLRTNKFEREVQNFISCNVLYMMMQYPYLRTNKFKREVQIFISSNVLYMTTQYTYLRYNKFKGDTRWHFERSLCKPYDVTLGDNATLGDGNAKLGNDAATPLLTTTAMMTSMTAAVAAAAAVARTMKTAAMTYRQQSTKRDGQSTII